MENFSIGVDLGGTAIKFASVSKAGKIIMEHRLPTEADKGAVKVIENMLTGIGYLLSLNSAEFNEKNLLGVGVGVPGVVSLDGGTLSYPPNLPGWEVVRLGDILRDKIKAQHQLKTSIFIENDANVAALGESMFGAGKIFDDFVMITLGTGVGGGIIIDNKIYRGVYGAAGEPGHITINYQSDTVHAGIRGTIEGMIGQKRIADYARSLVETTPESMLVKLCGGDLSKLEPKIITEAAEKGDRTALDVWIYVGEVLGAGLGSMVSILDIRKFVIGGGVAGAGDFVFKPAMTQLRKFTLKSMQKDLEIVPAKLGNSAGVMGAAAMCV